MHRGRGMTETVYERNLNIVQERPLKKKHCTRLANQRTSAA